MEVDEGSAAAPAAVVEDEAATEVGWSGIHRHRGCIKG